MAHISPSTKLPFEREEKEIIETISDLRILRHDVTQLQAGLDHFLNDLSGWKAGKETEERQREEEMKVVEKDAAERAIGLTAAMETRRRCLPRRPRALRPEYQKAYGYHHPLLPEEKQLFEGGDALPTGKEDEIVASGDVAVQIAMAELPPIVEAVLMEDHEAVIAFIQDEEEAEAQSDAYHASLVEATILASRMGKAEILKTLLERADVECSDAAGFSPMHHAACCERKFESVRTALVLMGARADPFRAATSRGLQPIHIAAAANNSDLLDFLITRAMVPVGSQTASGETSLHLALSLGALGIETVRALIRNGADIFEANPMGHYPREIALQTGSSIVQKIIEETEKAAFGGDAGKINLLLKEAVEHNAPQETVRLLKEKADPNYRQVNGMAILSTAVALGHTSVIRILIQAKADVNNRDPDGSGALHYCTSCPDEFHAVECARILCEEGKANVNEPSTVSFGLTPVHAAVLDGRIDLVRYLTSRPDYMPGARTREGDTPLQLVDFDESLEMFKILLDANEDPRVMDADGNTPALLAVKYGRDDVAELLSKREVVLNQTARPKPKLWEGSVSVALLRAVEWNDAVGVKEALSVAPANTIHSTEIVGRGGRTLLMRACALGNADVVKELLGWGADLTMPEAGDGANALHFACGHACFDAAAKVIEAILERCEWKTILAALTMKTFSESRSPIHVAAAVGNPEVLELLLAATLDLEGLDAVEQLASEQTTLGDTPMHLAALCGSVESINVLSAKGGRVGMENADGKVPLEVALAAGHVPVIQALKQAVSFELSRRTAQACEERDEETALELIKSKADIHYKPQRTNETLLFSACRYGCVDVFLTLMNLGARLDDGDVEQDSAIHLAAGGVDDACALRIIRHLVNDYDVPITGRVTGDALLPIHVACAAGNVSCVRFLVSHPQHEENAPTAAGDVCMHVAATYKDDAIARQMVATLLRGGENYNILDSKGRTPLNVAALSGNLQTAQLLLEVPTAAQDDEAAIVRDQRIRSLNTHERLNVPRLKNDRARQPHHEHQHNCNPLLFDAASNGDIKEIKSLILNGVFLDCQDAEMGQSAIGLAALGGHTTCVKILCEAGANFNSADSSGTPPSHHAASSGSLDALSVLLVGQGASLSVRDRAGFTLMHRAASAVVKIEPRQAMRLFRLILSRRLCRLQRVSRRALANADTDLGDTPLHILCACVARLPVKLAEKLVFFLLKAGGVPSIVNSSGQSALDIARHAKAPESVLKLLEFAMTQKIERLPADQNSDAETSEEEQDVLAQAAAAGSTRRRARRSGDDDEEEDDFYDEDEDSEDGDRDVSSSSKPNGIDRLARTEATLSAIADGSLLASGSSVTEAGDQKTPRKSQAIRVKPAGPTPNDANNNSSGGGNNATVSTVARLRRERRGGVTEQNAMPVMVESDSDLLETEEHLIQAVLRGDFAPLRRAGALDLSEAERSNLSRRKQLLEGSSKELVGTRLLHLAMRCKPYAALGKMIRFLVETLQLDIHSSVPGSKHAAIHEAARMGGRGRVELVVKLKADVNMQNDEGDTPLHLACRMGDLETVRYLLSRPDVDSTIINLSGETAAAIASTRAKSEKEVAVELADKLALRFNHAASAGRSGEIASLIGQGAMVDGMCDGQGAIHCAARHGRVDILAMLWMREGTIDLRDSHDCTALMIAAENMHSEAVIFLIDRGADPTLKDENGRNSLHHAAMGGSKNCFELVLNRLIGRFDFTRKDVYSSMPPDGTLQEVLCWEDNAGVNCVMLAGAYHSIDVLNYLTPFDEIFKALEARAINRMTALHLLVITKEKESENAVKCMNILLRYIDPRLVDENGNDALATLKQQERSLAFKKCADLLSVALYRTMFEWNMCCATIQNSFRTWKSRRIMEDRKKIAYYRERLGSCVRLQQCVRQWLSRREVGRQILADCILKMKEPTQVKFRLFPSLQRHAIMRMSAFLEARSSLAVDAPPASFSLLREPWSVMIRSATRIQRAYLRHYNRLIERSEATRKKVIERDGAGIIISRSYRVCLCRRKVQERRNEILSHLNKHAMVITSFFRKLYLSAHFRRTKKANRERKCALRIQTAIRGYIARHLFHRFETKRQGFITVNS